MAPEHSGPGYWRDETCGVLTSAVEAYLFGERLMVPEIAMIRAYLRQWIMAPVWQGDESLAALRASVDRIQSQPDIDKWLRDAIDLGMDPL